MKGLDKDYSLHVRVSRKEMEKYREAANELGMNISTLTRFVLNKEIRLIKDKL